LCGDYLDLAPRRPRVLGYVRLNVGKKDGGAAHHASFSNHIIRSQWNYQFTRALSLRAIAQYNGLLANPTYSSLRTTKNLSSDFLISCLVHPGTTVYVGYNSNLENLVPSLCLPVAGQ